MRVLIVAKTRRGSGACVGGITDAGRSVWLIAANAMINQHAGLEYEIRETWDIESVPDPQLVPPHVENIIVTRAQLLPCKADVTSVIHRFMPSICGGPQRLFDGLPQASPSGALYISQSTGVPRRSTMFWTPDQPLVLDCEGKRIRYRYPTPTRDHGQSLTFVGFQKPIEVIPARTLIRVSLAHWWRPKDGADDELRCYAQLSGWFPFPDAERCPCIESGTPRDGATHEGRSPRTLGVTDVHVTAIPTPGLDRARVVLKETFGYTDFLPVQADVIGRTLGRLDSLAVMPTGGGKSLCYQLPSLLFEGLTLVVSPLIALMQDQVNQLRQLDVSAAFLNCTLSLRDYVAATKCVRRGDLKILYAAPETVLRPETLLLLEQGRLDCFAVDEAHCISQWGHDFRPEYRRLQEVRQRFPRAVCLALTATATPRVREDVQHLLDLPDDGVRVASFNRPNPFLAVQPRDDGLAQTMAFLERHRDESGIIYCATRRQVDELSVSLNARGLHALPYHAGLDDETRRNNQNRFIHDDVPIMVTTIAFGMGINKSNVRFVVHYHLPNDLESWPVAPCDLPRFRVRCPQLESPSCIMSRRIRPFPRLSHHTVLAAVLGAMILIANIAIGRSQDLLITEFMADNDYGIADDDGELQDWIELYNPRPEPFPIAGWHLTDDANNLTKWTFPSGTIPPGSFLVVFASGKDRSHPDGTWHTNFKLDQDGEYLALIHPDGVTISSAFSPQFPAQIPGASFGLGMTVERFPIVAESWPARLLAPSHEPSGDWTLPGFDDADWIDVQMPIGYERPSEGGVDPDLPSIDVTQPGDLIQPTSFNSPGGEGVEMAIDNNPATKYLNFDKLNAGFVVTPALSDTVVIGLRLTSANDAPERDPASFSLAGSLDGIQFTPIAQGAMPDFPARFFTVEIAFENQQSYNHYRLLFPTVREANAANSVQIAEVELLGHAGPPPPLFTDLINTDVENLLFEKHSSALLRLPFDLPDAAPLDDLVLRVRYDDGFVAFLNGVPIAQANAPPNLAFNSTATLDRPASQAVRSETFSLANHAHQLNPGTNLLSLHALNDRSDSPDFLLSAELVNLQVATSAPGFFTQPTPGEFNADSSRGRAAEPVPSVPRGFYSGPIVVSLSCATEDATIRYTLDGRTPSPDVGHLYSGPIQIVTGGPLRAIAFKEGWIPSQTTTHTYLILDEIIRQNAARAASRGFPPTWGSTTADYEMDPSMVGQNGQDIYGGRYAQSIRDDLLALPSISIVMQLDDLFGPTGIYSNPENRGDSWERPASFEIIDPANPTAGFQVNAGIRIQGGAFRRFDLTKKKSFRVVFRKQYGPPTLNHPLFGPDATDRFNNFILRANSNDAWPYAGGVALYLRDTFAMETARAMGMVASHSRFAHLYINGLYWGLYNPVERPDHTFSASYHGGDPDTWDALNQDGLTHGSVDAWNRLLTMLNEDVSNHEVYQRLQGRNPDGTRNPDYENLLDVDNLIDYMILNFYIGNTDWPHRNFWIGRDRAGTDGFQFYPWDSETALGFTGLNTDRTGVDGAVARPYGATRANAEFRIRFADRAHRHLSEGGALYVNPAQPAWNPDQPQNNVPAARVSALASIIEAAIVGEAARWGDQMGTGPYTRDAHWIGARNSLLNDYLPRRSTILLDQLRNAGLYPRTEAPTFNQPGGRVEPGFWLTLSAPEGTIYFTLDGSDPRRPVEIEVLSQSTLVSSSTPKRVLVPSIQNGGDSLGNTWRNIVTGFNDAAWTAGSGGVGYDTDTTYTGLITMDVRNAMLGINGSAFVRIPFDYDGAALDRLNSMTLRARFDDGFVAYLNGVLIAAANSPPSPSWNSVATALNPDEAAIQFRAFDVTPFLSSLRVGPNLLAIHGLNVSTGSSDFLIDVELEAAELRIIGGDVTAHVYAGPMQVVDLTTIKARTLNGPEWSALSEATFLVGHPRLIITQLHYHPSNPTPAEQAAGFTNDDDFEFVELFNAGSGTLDLAGVRFVDGVSFDFTSSAFTMLAPGQYLLLVQNPAAFEFRYGTGYPIAGQYEGRFSNAGERVEIVDATGQTLLAFTYGTNTPWPASADGQGPSIILADVNGDPNDPANWTPSEISGGSPAKNPAPGQLRIDHVSQAGENLTIHFTGLAGKSYVVQIRYSLDAPWITLQSIPVATADGLRNVTLEWDPILPVAFFQLVQAP